MGRTTAQPGVLRRAGPLAIGASAALLADPLIVLVDTAATGQMGVTEQAALSVGAAAVTLATWLLYPLLFVQTTDVARAWGRGDRPAARRLVATGAAAGLIAGTAVAVVLVVVFGPLVTAAADDGVGRQADTYVRLRACGLPLLALTLVGHGALRGRSDVRGSAVIALSTAALHAAGAALVVVLEGGLAALALVAVLAQGVCALALRSRLRTMDLLEPTLDRPRPARVVAGLAALRRAGPLAVRGAGLGAATAAMAAAAAAIGPRQAAAHLVTFQVWLLVALALEGWKAATQVIVAQGRDLPAPVRRAEARALHRFSVLLGALAAVALLATSRLLPRHLAADDATAELATSLWPLAALALALGSVAFTRDGVEFGLERYRANTSRTLRGCATWLLAAAAGVLTGSLAVLWAVFALGLAVRILGSPSGLPAAKGAPPAHEAGQRVLPR